MNNPLMWLAPIEVSEVEKSYQWKNNKHHLHLNINYTNFSGKNESLLPENLPSIAYSDLQRGIGASLESSLGSGRSCFYKNKYFKGIGRTPLVKFWTDKSHYLHSNGLLFPSGAFREIIFSQYLTNKNQSLINPATDISLIDGTEYSKLILNRIYQNTKFLPGKIEEDFVAQTIKDGNFIRFSNIKWAYSNMGSMFVNDKDFSNLNYLISCIHHGLEKKPQDVDVENYEGELSSLFEKLFSNSLQAIKNVIKMNCLGVKLGSLGNNFSLDGRFVDLEVPVFVGQNHLCFHLPDNNHSISEIFECLGALFQFKLYLVDFGRWLKQGQLNSPHQKSKNYFSVLSSTFEKSLAEYSWLWDDPKIIEYIDKAYLKENMQLSQKAKILINLALNRPYTQVSFNEIGQSEKIDINFAQYQIGIIPKCYHLPGLIEDSNNRCISRATIANDFLLKLAEFNTPTETFKYLSEISDQLNKN